MPTIGIDRAKEFITRTYQQRFNLDELAGAINISKYTLCRSFHRRHNQSPMRWTWEFRATLAACLIKRFPECSLIASATSCGFCSAAHFSRIFREVHRTSPSAFRRHILAHTRMVTRRGQHACPKIDQSLIEEATERMQRRYQ